MISASGEAVIHMMMEICQHAFDGKGTPDEWQTSVLVPIFKRKTNVRSGYAFRRVKLLEHAMKLLKKY